MGSEKNNGGGHIVLVLLNLWAHRTEVPKEADPLEPTHLTVLEPLDQLGYPCTFLLRKWGTNINIHVC